MKDLEKNLDKFLTDEEIEAQKAKGVIKKKGDLIERIDKVYYTENGKQFLTERYY